MGIYGALATAVTGLRAQSFALENISGNIANSQTTGYKRIETDFLDLIPDAPVSRQTPGAVIGSSRATNTVGGDIKTASSDTYMALNGNGFFVVEQKIGQNDGNAVFGGTSYYTRRGDFDLDREGYLVNGAGYYLKGLPINQSTGNISGSVPSVIQISNSFLPAQLTTRVDYQLNLPQLPKTAAYDPNTVNSELMNSADFVATAADVTATATGTTALVGANDADSAGGPPAGPFTDGDTFTINIDGVAVTFEAESAGGVASGNIAFDINGDIDTALASLQTGLQANGGTAAADATVALSGGNVRFTLGTNLTSSFTLTDGTGTPLAAVGVAAGDYTYTDSSIGVQVPTVTGAQSDLFVSESIAGGAITVYASNGAPVNVQLRWAKVDSAARGGTDTWRLYYLTNSEAGSADIAWRDVGTNYSFAANGALTPNVVSTTVNNLTVNGVTIGNVNLQHNTGGVTQFADANGTSQVTALSQNGYAAGEFVSVTINDDGRVVASYSNGQQVELAQVVTAQFSAANSLKRLDGGIFAATSESGEAILDSGGGIVSASLESSNTDISEEFTKLIVTQQAYAAGTRIVSTSDQMLQEALNMLR
ncbi:MAG: flagellar hook-basal body complex protein [Alphaproteobacteria bacterium]|nr:flagellar hook-basal body complex protein [Alphaproteobacteria bacterium]